MIIEYSCLKAKQNCIKGIEILLGVKSKEYEMNYRAYERKIIEMVSDYYKNSTSNLNLKISNGIL